MENEPEQAPFHLLGMNKVYTILEELEKCLTEGKSITPASPAHLKLRDALKIMNGEQDITGVV